MLEEQERQRLEDEEAQAKALEDEDPLEVEFDEEAANIQEDLFIKRGMPPMNNKDIIESVGLEYEHVSYEQKPKKKGKKRTGASPTKPVTSSIEDFEAEVLEEGDQALPGTDDGAEVPTKSEDGEVSSMKAVSVDNPTKDYVAATLHAWNACPTIVKK